MAPHLPRPADPPAVAPDDAVVFDVGGFAPKTPVSGIFRSTPIALGSVQSAADGTVSFRFSVPAVPPGRHHLELTGTGPDGGTVQVVIPVDVLAPAVIATTTIAAPVRVLPRTGSTQAVSWHPPWRASRPAWCCSWCAVADRHGAADGPIASIDAQWRGGPRSAFWGRSSCSHRSTFRFVRRVKVGRCWLDLRSAVDARSRPTG